MAIDPSGADLQRFGEGGGGRPLVMVQLLRFAEGGRDRYLEYSAAAQRVLAQVGAQVLYGGECTEPLLATGGSWDAVVLVRYPNRAAYLEMLENAPDKAPLPEEPAWSGDGVDAHGSCPAP